MSSLIVHSTPPAAKRGGMSPNSFGGHTRLDKCNLQRSSKFGDVDYDVVSDMPGVRTLWVGVIKDAVQQYLFFGLGRNGPTREEFWSACEFLFNIRASKPETWQEAKVMREVYYDEDLGRRASHVQMLSDDVLRAGCLDSIWANVYFPMTLETFVGRLKAERRNLLQRNWEQVVTFLGIPGDARSMDGLL